MIVIIDYEFAYGYSLILPMIFLRWFSFFPYFYPSPVQTYAESPQTWDLAMTQSHSGSLTTKQKFVNNLHTVVAKVMGTDSNQSWNVTRLVEPSKNHQFQREQKKRMKNLTPRKHTLNKHSQKARIFSRQKHLFTKHCILENATEQYKIQKFYPSWKNRCKPLF